LSGSGELPGERLDRSLAELRRTFLASVERRRTVGERPAAAPSQGWPAAAPVAHVGAWDVQPVRPIDRVATVAPVDRPPAEQFRHPGPLRQMLARFFGRWSPWQR
jgi:hypothetical protein